MRRTKVLLLLFGVGLVLGSGRGHARGEPLGAGYFASGEDLQAESMSELWPRLRACAARTLEEPEDWRHSFECREMARRAIQGDEGDREQLWVLYDELPAEAPLRSFLLEAFLDWHLEQATAELADPGESLPETTAMEAVLAVDETPLPNWLLEAPDELQRAWRLHDFVGRKRPEEAQRPAGQEPIGFQANDASFRRLVADFLRGRSSAEETAREVSRFEWGGWCGTGSQVLHGPQNRTLLIANLRQGRLDLAARAALAISSQASLGLDPELGAWHRRLLVAAHLDWESLYLGGLVEGDDRYARPLARLGSERAARLLLAAADLPQPYVEQERLGDSATFLSALGALIGGRPCQGYHTSTSADLERDPDAPVLGGDVELAALDLLAERIGPAAGRAQAEAASHALVTRCRPESREAFRAMLGSPYSEVRRRGVLGLRDLREVVAEARPAPPVVFRLVVDGRPAEHREIEWVLHSSGGHLSSSATTDQDGKLTLDRDRFVDPSARITSVLLSTADLTSPDDTWFSLQVPRPLSLDVATTLEVRTGSLAVALPGLPGGSDDAPPVLRLSTTIARFDGQPTKERIRADLPLRSSRTVFSHLQHGRYSVEVEFPDGRVLEALDVAVGERPATAQLRERSDPDE